MQVNDTEDDIKRQRALRDSFIREETLRMEIECFNRLKSKRTWWQKLCRAVWDPDHLDEELARAEEQLQRVWAAKKGYGERRK